MCKIKIVFHSEQSVLSFFVTMSGIACTNDGSPLIFICCIAGSQVSSYVNKENMYFALTVC